MVKVTNSKILINALSSAFQVIFTGIIFFFLYKYLEQQLSAEKLGVWSLVIATSSITNLANFGIAAGLVKFIAEYIVTQRKKEIPTLVSTAFISVFVFFVILLILIYFVAILILKQIIEPQYFLLAKGILPFSLLSLFISGLSGVFSSTLEGMQKNYIKNIIYSVAILFFFLSTIFLTPKYDLYGVAYAQVIQAIFIFVFSFAFSLKFLFVKGFAFQLWSKEKFQEIIGYGLKFQIISFCQMLYEPTTKMLLSVFGGLGLVWYYEMASRLVSQVRGLIVNANSVLIPVITEAHLKDKSSVGKIYEQSISLLVNITIPMMLGILFFSCIISKLWIGEIHLSFIIFCFILTLSNLLNIFSNPAYFGFLGQGILRPLVIQHVALGIMNLVLSYILGYYFETYGVVAGWGISLATTSYIGVYKYDQINKFNFLKTLRKDIDVIFFGGLILCASIILIIFRQKIYDQSFIITVFLQTGFYMLILGLLIHKKIDWKNMSFISKFLRKNN